MRLGEFSIHKNLRIWLAAAFFSFAFFTFSSSVNAVYPVAGRSKLRLNGLLLTIFIFLGGFAFTSSAYGATDVYYSVGQSAADLKIGTPTVTISGGAAIFSVAQTGNIGVGDRVTYNTDQIAYISAKTNPDSAHWSLVTALGTPAADITDSVVVSIKREFTSLAAAIAASSNVSHINNTDLTAANVVLNIPCYYDSGADTTAVTVSGFTTGANNNIKIYTPNNTSTESNNSQRHQGKWDDGKYHLYNSVTYSNTLDGRTGYIVIDGLQIYGSVTNKSVIDFINDLNNASFSIVRNSIIKSNNSVNVKGVYTNRWMNNYYIYNNVFIDIYCGIDRGDGNAYIYSNTIINSFLSGINSSGNRISVVKNNIIQGGSTNFSGTFNSASTNNISSDGSAPGSNAKINTTVSFVDSVNKDFHLSPNDIAAKNAGTDLSADANLAFSTDIDGQTRSGAWDIGADEGATAIYYSVGQNTTDHKTGTPNIDISNGTATFSVAQTATNLGVGDKVTYNTSSVAYISQKISTTQWKLTTATGGIPADVTGQAVNSVAHAFNSLNAAVAGASGVSYLNTNDLRSNNVQLNFPCYYDSGADTTAVTVQNYTTAPANFIKIYTPNNTINEVNQSQRHQGKWDNAKYSIVENTVGKNIISVSLSDVSIEGLQLSEEGDNGASDYNGISIGDRTNINISNNIIKNTSTGGGSVRRGINYNNINDVRVKANIYNNIVYGYVIGMYFSGSQGINVYNNVSVNGESYGYFTFRESYQPLLKNNIAQNCADGYKSQNNIWNSGNSNNISDLAADAPGTNSKNSTTVSFVDAANKDFHLSLNDTTAKNAGTSLASDSAFAFSTDIDGQTRTGSWDIGADESATAIYYSVGQNTNDHKTGTPTVDISNGTATFSIAQTATNLGVGDKVTYNTTSVAYISAKISTTQWKLITATGGVPTNVTGQSVNSIAHAFASLNSAVSGASSLLGTSDLVSGNYQLNLPCYYDSGADTTVFRVLGYETGVGNYIKIYAPDNLANEVNGSQRHEGKWNDKRYAVDTSGNLSYPYTNGIGDEFVRIEGLQFLYGSNSANTTSGISISPNTISSDIQISNSIIRGNTVSTHRYSGIYITGNSLGIKVKIFNNLIYSASNYFNGSGAAINIADWSPVVRGYVYISNNTIDTEQYGINNNYTNSYYVTAKNNIVQNSTDGFKGGFDASSDYNISSLAGDAPGVNSKNSTTVSFVDSANKNFHLAPNDTAAKKAGTSLASDSVMAFTTDIDGQERAGSWDIGADEFQETQMQSQISAPNLDSGLIGHWTFDGDDVNGNNIKDISGNNNNGANSGGTPALGKLGQAMNFDGTTNYVDFGTGSTLNIPANGEFTLSGWVKTTENYGTIVSFRNSTDVGSIVDVTLGYDGVVYDSGKIMGIVRRHQFGSGHARVTGATVNDGVWHQFVLTRDTTGNIELFLDGISQGNNTGAWSQGPITTDRRSVGVERRWVQDNFGTADQRYLAGSVDDVRVYNRKLSTEEISSLSRLGINTLSTENSAVKNGLVGYWPLDGDDLNGTIAYDRAGSNNGTITGAVPALGKIGQGMSFNGSSDHISMPYANIDFERTNPFSLSIWAKRNSSGSQATWQSLIGKGNSAGYGGIFFAASVSVAAPWSSDKGIMALIVGSNSQQNTIKTPNNSFLPDVWNHVVFTYDGSSTVSGMKIYINGISQTITTIFSGVNASIKTTSPWMIGDDNTNDPFNGTLDEARIYNKTLSATEVANLYNSGKVEIRK